ncbi:class I SAM-dependent methyltransferase [Nocardiopsis changdeensis]|uniref:Methyltransferase domain-containing protein n=1 Tax=Nocardiopsis changdeensis TaxID=2831969 RepID=A0ABX8BV22_9ACTN|nr:MULTISPECIES: class I SAM-dependent methyltransferase [Nocardiopsis]QUX25555.1 methyltransferase domain-containing protein [Nocardiopsis changdeensis]QYX35941.1 methyltransferase domain-containing protein [Nocardiopsis sp. MT53]
MDTDPKETVRRGYDALSHRYDEAFGTDAKYGPWIADLLGRLPGQAEVLDLGCGTGVPVVRDLAAAGHRVRGVDISAVQIARARALVPAAAFARADIAALDLPGESLDAVVCLYALIHLPLAEQPALLGRIGRWLRPGGTLLATTGHRAWTGTDPDWLGGGVPMWWSQADAARYREWITGAGLVVEAEEFVPEGEGGHALFLARRP